MSRLSKVVNEIKRLTNIKPKVGIILGSHLGDFEEKFKLEDRISYSVLDDFPISKTSGHRGRFIFGYISNIPIIIMQGRIHYYEGYSMQDVVFPIKVMAELGIKSLYITNSAQSLNSNYSVGDLAVINDYIMNVESPLRDLKIEYDREKFDSLFPIFDKKLIKIVNDVSKYNYDIVLRNSVYTQIQGPLIPNKLESKYLKNQGGDLVGMSSICEAIYAKYLGIRVLCISCISSYAFGITEDLFTHSEMINTYKSSRKKIFKLLKETILKDNN